MAASNATRASVQVDACGLSRSRMCKRAEERGPIFRHRIPHGARLPSAALKNHCWARHCATSCAGSAPAALAVVDISDIPPRTSPGSRRSEQRTYQSTIALRCIRRTVAEITLATLSNAPQKCLLGVPPGAIPENLIGRRRWQRNVWRSRIDLSQGVLNQGAFYLVIERYCVVQSGECT
jgi:hypothetical protein